MPPKVKPLPDNTRINTANTGKAPAIRRMKLKYPELSEAQIAKQVGCSSVNVHNVLKRFLGKAHSTQELAEYQNAKADVYDALQMRYLMSITNAKINKTGVVALTTGAAILEDKARTIRGQATQINVSLIVDAMAAVREMRKRRG